MKSTIAAIDFGTCKIVTLVAETSGTQRCDIIGAGIAAYDGFLDGEWNNTVMLNEAIQKSITEAETQSKRKIREINVGVPGEFTRVYAVETSVTIQGADPHVTPRHVEKIFANADKQLSPVRGVVVHRSPAWFMVDGGKKTLEPVGLKGTELKALVSFVVADTFFLDDVMARLRDMNITVSGFFSSSTGEAMLYLLEEDRDRTAILIDIGYLCTDVLWKVTPSSSRKRFPWAAGTSLPTWRRACPFPWNRPSRSSGNMCMEFLRFRNPIRYPAEKGSRPKPSRRSRWRPCWNPAWTRLRT